MSILTIYFNFFLLQILAYVDDIYETLVKTPRKEFEKIEKELKEETPEPLHMMLGEKQAKNEAIDLFCSRKRKINTDCPPTCTGSS